MVIVESDEIDGATLEEVVAWRRLVTARRDGARRIVTLYDLCQMLCQQRLYRQLSLLRQRRSVMSCVQNQVRLLKRQRVSLC